MQLKLLGAFSFPKQPEKSRILIKLWVLRWNQIEARTNDRSSLFPVVIHIADSFGECVPGRSMYMNFPQPLTIWPSSSLPKSLSPCTRQKAVGQLQTTAPRSLRSISLFARKTTLHFLSLDVLSLISISKFEYVHFLERIGYLKESQIGEANSSFLLLNKSHEQLLAAQK